MSGSNESLVERLCEAEAPNRPCGTCRSCLLLAADLSQRLHGLLREINDLSLNTGTCRVAAYFLQHAPADERSFELPLAKQILASRLSIKPETLSRIFRSLTNAGLIDLRGNRVTILDRRHLEELAQTRAQDEYSLEDTFHYPSQGENRSN